MIFWPGILIFKGVCVLVCDLRKSDFRGIMERTISQETSWRIIIFYIPF